MHGTVYVGVTNDIARRAYEHRSGQYRGFTKTYGVHRLVWCEGHPTMPDAIRREKALKGRPRAWKVQLVEAMNPNWDDLFQQLNW